MKRNSPAPGVIAFATLLAISGSCVTRQPPAALAEGCSTSFAPAASASLSAPVPGSSSKPPVLPYDFEVSCARAVSSRDAAAVRLDGIGRQCAFGMERIALAEPMRQVLADAWWEVPIDLGKHACARIAVVSTPPEAVLEARLVDPEGKLVVAGRQTRDPLLMGAQGPFCVGKGGVHRVQVRSLGSRAELSMGAWRAVAPPPASASSSR